MIGTESWGDIDAVGELPIRKSDIRTIVAFKC